jgi:phage N-6-adenine-methyltransferase
MRCKVCRQHFSAERSDACTCSSRCRQKAYRRRLSVTQTGTQNVTLNTQWETPQRLFDELNNEFHFTLDVCALACNTKCPHFYNPIEDGLKQNWTGICWMNPPYDRSISQWARKAYEAAQAGTTVVGLLPVWTDTKWWQSYVMPARDIRYLSGRLRFNNVSSNARFPNAIVIWTPTARKAYSGFAPGPDPESERVQT